MKGTGFRTLAFGAAITYVCATFAFRDGIPGFRHDWTWAPTPAGFVRWFVDSGISQWNPHGLGTAGQIPTLNVVFGLFALLAEIGLSPQAVLFVVSVGYATASLVGFVRMLSAFDIATGPFTAASLGLCYAFSPIAFQKAVAGHLFWLAAYAALPWFASAIRRACRPGGRTSASFVVAALLYAASSTQIQFIAFDAFVMLTIVATYAPRSRAWLGVALVLAVGLLHNANGLLAPSRPPGEFSLAAAHGTVVWETDMSAPFLDLARFGGYGGYGVEALPRGWERVDAVADTLLLVFAVAGLVVAHDRRALVFGIVGVGALAFASGWYGPLAVPLAWALEHSGAFTLFRELFHVMALYALAAIACAAIAIARLRRWSAPVAVVLAALVALPFLSLGLPRMVPVVTPLSVERAGGDDESPRQALLPYQEPISSPGLRSGGADPARFDVDDVASGNPPLVVRSVLDATVSDARRHALLADLGVARATWRDARASLLASTFEPGVGADFTAFDERQVAQRARYARGVAIGAERAALQLEDPNRTDALEAFIADDRLPPGRFVPLRSSFAGNGIRSEWVSGRLWSWQAPDDMNVLADPILTESSNPTSLPLDAAGGDTVYILAASRGLTLDDIAGTVVHPVVDEHYAWYRWRLSRPSAAPMLRGSGFTSVARCIVSSDPTWRPEPASRGPRAAPANASALAVRQTVPWSLEALLPATAGPRRLVYARTYSPDWHLFIDGVDRGAGFRADGMFDGWDVPATARDRNVRLEFVPQRRSNAYMALDAVVEIGLAGFAVFAFSRSRAVAPQ